jgi:hypothetical protein
VAAPISGGGGRYCAAAAMELERGKTRRERGERIDGFMGVQGVGQKRIATPRKTGGKTKTGKVDRII